MAKSDAATVDAYLAELPEERRATVMRVRDVVLANLPEGYEETMSLGMPAYVVPLAAYPSTYNKQPLMYAALAAQKHYTSLYLMGVYTEPETERWFHDAYRASGKRLDVGKSCVRFKRAEDLPLDLIGAAIARITPARFIRRYEAVRAQRPGRAGRVT